MGAATFRRMRMRVAAAEQSGEKVAHVDPSAAPDPPQPPVASVPLEPTPGMYEPKGGGGSQRRAR